MRVTDGNTEASIVGADDPDYLPFVGVTFNLEGRFFTGISSPLVFGSV